MMRLLLFPVFLLGGQLPLALEAASPELERLLPPGGQRGQEVEVRFTGKRLGDTVDLFTYRPGLELVELLEVGDREVKARLRITPEARPGPHELRLRTRTGISELRTFHVGLLPVVPEAEPNSTFEKPQEIPLDVTVSGVIENEDVDVFQFRATGGQRVTAEVTGLRLGRALFDSHVTILDARRFELATGDDHPLTRQDGLASVIIPEDGLYQVHVRESSYGGNGNCHYLLHLGTYPRPVAAFPAGGRAGESVEVRLLGDVKGEKNIQLELPADAPRDFSFFPGEDAALSPSPLSFRVTSLEEAREVEPNVKFEEATPGKAPGAFNGVLGEPGDLDCFRFSARKGQTLDIQVFGRRLRSPIDPVIHLFDAKDRRRLAGNDDAGGPDSSLRFRVPADLECILRVGDHLRRGGPTFVYRVEVREVEPRLALSIPRARRFSQDGQTVTVPRGNRMATLIQVERTDFSGAVDLEAAGLPAGVEMVTPGIPAPVTVTPVVFQASPGGELAGSLVDLRGRLRGSDKGPSGSLEQEVELVYGNPNNAVYWSRRVDRLAVAVAEEAPFHLEIIEPKAPLVRSGILDLPVVVRRREGFGAPVSLRMLFDPPSTGSARGVKIPEGKDRATIRLNANGNAATGEWKIAVTGTAGGVTVSSQLATLTIAPPFLAIQLERAATETGKPTTIFGKVEVVTPFEGKARVKLVGLPARVSAPEVEIAADAKAIDFAVTVEPESRPGRHRNIFCQVQLQHSGETVIHSTGSTELRIDRPLPPRPGPEVAAKKPPPKKPEPEKEKPPAPRRLTRLEKLRKQAREARESGGQDS